MDSQSRWCLHGRMGRRIMGMGRGPVSSLKARSDTVDAVVREMLDAMRNAHLQMVMGDAPRAIEWLRDADDARKRLDRLFHGDIQNEALAGRILFDVIGQRMGALSDFAREYINGSVAMAEVVAFVEKPLDPAK